MREVKIELHLRKRIEKEGLGKCLKFPPIFYRGFPDRILLIRGGLIRFVETKAPNGSPTLVQRKVHGMLRGLGFRVDVLNTIEAVDEYVDEIIAT